MYKDSITLERIKLMHPKVREEVSQMYDEICQNLNKGVLCRFAYTLRTFTEQDRLFAQGRTRLFDISGRRLGIVTQARGGQSIHNYGLAFDIVLLIDRNGDGIYESASWDMSLDTDKDGVRDWQEVVKICKKYGWTWGGDWTKFKDNPHFEKTFGNTWKTLKQKYDKKEFIKGTEYVTI